MVLDLVGSSHLRCNIHKMVAIPISLGHKPRQISQALAIRQKHRSRRTRISTLLLARDGTVQEHEPLSNIFLLARSVLHSSSKHLYNQQTPFEIVSNILG